MIWPPLPLGSATPTLETSTAGLSEDLVVRQHEDVRDSWTPSLIVTDNCQRNQFLQTNVNTPSPLCTSVSKRVHAGVMCVINDQRTWGHVSPQHFNHMKTRGHTPSLTLPSVRPVHFYFYFLPQKIQAHVTLPPGTFTDPAKWNQHKEEKKHADKDRQASR